MKNDSNNIIARDALLRIRSKRSEYLRAISRDHSIDMGDIKRFLLKLTEFRLAGVL